MDSLVSLHLRFSVKQAHYKLVLYTLVGCKYCDEHVCVCLSVCPLAQYKSHMTKLHQFLCVCCIVVMILLSQL